MTLWKEFDMAILESVKANNYDWYMKCLTYFFICKEKRRKPARDEYFYDGTYCYKWLTTQKRVLSKELGFSIDSDQQAMLKIILDEVDLIEFRKENEKSIKRKEQENLILQNTDDFLDAIEKSVYSYGKILPDLTLNQVNLCEAWRIICQPLMQKEVPFTEKQINRIKKLRREMILKTRSKLNHVDSINFGYELACFADSLHFSFKSLSVLLSISESTMKLYLTNANLPFFNQIEKMLSAMDSLDISNYRRDQINDIHHFRNVLISIKKYRKGQDNVLIDCANTNVFSFTGFLLKDIPISYLKEIHDTDITWYEEFKKIYRIMCAGMKNDSFSFRLPFCKWFKNEMYKVSLGESTPIKKDLLHYLYFLYQNNLLLKKESSFMHKFIPLANFIYEHERIPQIGELLLMNNKDGRSFYIRIIHSYFGNIRYCDWQSDSLKEQMKLLIQYVLFCRRKKCGYQKDKIEGEKLFLGERLNNIRICLRFSRENFAKKMGLDTKELFALYSNRISLKEQHVESLLQLFEEMKGKKLRRDQLEEMQEFIQVLRTKKLEDGFAFKFCPKE